MTESYKKINYTLRPAKHIERKMLCEAFRRLDKIALLQSYRYVGFGSLYFSDFILFHKSLGITNMVSIECNSEDQERFDFNLPFGCIKLEYGWSNEILPKLKWDVNTILWLDYDDPINRSVLTDLEFFCANANPGSMIIVTLNAHQAKGKKYDELFASLKETIGETNIPVDIKKEDFQAWEYANLLRRIINNTIQKALSDRNGVLQQSHKIEYQQLFNFHYRDGARMLTTGGIIYDWSQLSHFRACCFEQLAFYRPDSASHLLEIPCLTHKELRYLDSLFPLSPTEASIERNGIPNDDIEKYAKVYRYFPSYAETDL